MAGQSDRAVESGGQEAGAVGHQAQETGSRVTGRRASKKSSAPVIDPYLPTAGNFGYRVSRYELELEYKVAINRLAGTATVTTVTLAWTSAGTRYVEVA